MRIIVVHNIYQHRGGEDSVVESEIDLLRNQGHEVEVYLRRNEEIGVLPGPSLAAQTLWSKRTFENMGRLTDTFHPDVIHVHNTLPLISPSIYWAASRARVPVVQTLHNFRLLCPQAMLLREGKVCEECVGRIPWRGVAHSCYHNSLAQSTVLATMLMLHRIGGTYRDKVTRYIALNDFSRSLFVRGGLPAGRLRVKPNFVDLPAPTRGVRSGILFVGRLSFEKGVGVLAESLRYTKDLTCDVVGSGPEEEIIANLERVRMTGWLSKDGVIERMRGAIALVMPSLWYEVFPRTLVEAFACGLPVIASRLGSMQAIIRDGETGLLFEPGNAADLGQKLSWAAAHPEEMRRMGEAARTEYEHLYTPEINYHLLMGIYREAMDEANSNVG